MIKRIGTCLQAKKSVQILVLTHVNLRQGCDVTLDKSLFWTLLSSSVSSYLSSSSQDTHWSMYKFLRWPNSYCKL